MSPITHPLASWLVANIPKNLSRRDMLLITAAGVAPDVDGLGSVVEIATINKLAVDMGRTVAAQRLAKHHHRASPSPDHLQAGLVQGLLACRTGL